MKKWYSVVQGEPGFTKEAFDAIASRVKQTEKPIICNIVIDEMSIRKQISFLNGKFYGGVDLGTNNNPENDNVQEATNALVFLAVCFNEHWKIPLGYFLIHSFSGCERANLLTKCLELFSDTKAKCYSITFDGAPCNLSMRKILGANFDYFSVDFKPWIQNPAFQKSNHQPIYIFWDAAHMLKLTRNTLGDRKVLLNSQNKEIKWNDIVTLQEIQESRGLHAANKLKKCHIRYFENKMNVRLAVQTLSCSVSSSLIFCEELQLITEARSTAQFCKMFNDAFDLCNCRNKLSKGDYSFPITEENLPRIELFLNEFKSYVVGLRLEKSNSCPEGEIILKSARKTGFLGLIICITNLIHLFKTVKNDMSFLMSYKFSQDFLEVFFSALRSRGGFNDNPNAIQFRSAYKRLLIRHEISGSLYGNCTLLDSSSILFVGANTNVIHADSIFPDRIENLTSEESILVEEFEHDYDYYDNTNDIW